MELKPDYAEAYYNRGLAYRDRGDFDRAIEDFNEAIELNHDYVDAYYNRGLAYRSVGMADRSIADLTKAIELDQIMPKSWQS